MYPFVPGGQRRPAWPRPTSSPATTRSRIPRRSPPTRRSPAPRCRRRAGASSYAACPQKPTRTGSTSARWWWNSTASSAPSPRTTAPATRKRWACSATPPSATCASSKASADMDWRRSVSALAIGAISLGAQAQSLGPEQKRFHAIYKELVETNTTHSAGDTTLAAQRMARHLREAGFAEADVQILEPFPKKGNLVARFKGDGSKKPLLLVAHLDVVEALRSDWQSDPFVLQETGGYFTARGSIDDKSMAAAFVSVLSQLRREGFKPKRDLILALTADEERGDVPSNGVYWIVNNRRELIDAEFGINEGGGGELREGKPFLHRMQVAEKMYTTYNFLVRNPGGHSSLPMPENAIYTLAEAPGRVDAHRLPGKPPEVTRTYFQRSAKLSSGSLAEDM